VKIRPAPDITGEASAVGVPGRDLTILGPAESRSRGCSAICGPRLSTGAVGSLAELARGCVAGADVWCPGPAHPPPLDGHPRLQYTAWLVGDRMEPVCLCATTEYQKFS